MLIMAISKIKTVSPRKPYEGAYGKMYYATITLENWDKWSLWAKEEWKYTTWQEIEYTIEETTNGNKIKIMQQQKGWKSFTKDYKKDAVSFALSYAKDIMIAWKVKEDQLLPTADKLYEWMIGKY